MRSAAGQVQGLLRFPKNDGRSRKTETGGYFAFAMLRGRSGKPIGHTRLVYPYPFLDLPRLGWRKFTGYVMGMLLSFFLLGYGMMWLGRLVGTPLA